MKTVKEKVSVLTSSVFISLVRILEEKYDRVYEDYEELAKDLNEEFNLQLTKDEVLTHFYLDVELQDVKLIAKHCL